MKVSAIALSSLALASGLGLAGCGGLSTGCPTGDVAAYQACQSRQRAERTDWGTEFRRNDIDPRRPYGNGADPGRMQ